jgi:hypothetical protein
MAPPRQATELSGPPLAAGQLRYLTASATGMRVIEARQRGVIVERIPGDVRLWLRGLSELRRSPMMAPDGFRFRWLTERLDPTRADEQEVLEAILADERARGGDRIRIKVLDEYLGPIPDCDPLRERLVTALTGNDRWRWEGAGIDAGYMPSESKLDWRIRWERARLPLSASDPPPTEVDAVARLREALTGYSVEVLGRIFAERWVPRPIRYAARDELVVRWRRKATHDEFRLVLDDAVEALLEGLAEGGGTAELLDASVDPVLSLSMRGVAFSLLPVRAGWSGEAEIAKRASRSPNSRVASHWFRLWSGRAEGIVALSILLRSPPPNGDDDGTAVVKSVRDALAELGADALPAVLEACASACRVGAVRNVGAWLTRIDPDERGALLTNAVEGLATLRRLRDGQSDEFTLLGMPRRQVQEGLARWLRESGRPGDGEAPAVDWSAPSHDEEWERSARRVAAHLRECLDYDALGDAVIRLVDGARKNQARIEELLRSVESPENARRVLAHEAADATRGDRADLLRSARSEAAEERDTERMHVARIVSETITAIQRTAATTQAEGLIELSARVAELASDLGLMVTGAVGEHVRIDPAQHETRGREGEDGEIRRVGIVDVLGRTLVRPGVAAVRRT